MCLCVNDGYCGGYLLILSSFFFHFLLNIVHSFCLFLSHVFSLSPPFEIAFFCTLSFTLIQFNTKACQFFYPMYLYGDCNKFVEMYMDAVTDTRRKKSVCIVFFFYWYLTVQRKEKEKHEKESSHFYFSLLLFSLSCVYSSSFFFFFTFVYFLFCVSTTDALYKRDAKTFCNRNRIEPFNKIIVRERKTRIGERTKLL